MRRRDRFLSILGVLVLIAGIKIAQQLYRYYVFSEERLEIVRLEEEVDSAGLGVIGTQLRADTLRQVIDAADTRLGVARQALDRVEVELARGAVSIDLERSYRADLARYNEEVDRRNALFRQWRATVDSNHVHVERYNLLVDSIRALATVMGEPYYPIMSPAEIAVRHESGTQPE
jgi:hypothetical protein